MRRGGTYGGIPADCLGLLSKYVYARKEGKFNGQVSDTVQLRKGKGLSTHYLISQVVRKNGRNGDRKGEKKGVVIGDSIPIPREW